MRRLFGLCVVFFSVCALSVSMFVPVSLSAQPPIDTTTFYEGNIAWGPNRADPARAYDTHSGQLIFNVYENLIALNKELYWDFVPKLATNVPERMIVTDGPNNITVVDLTNPENSQWQSGSTVYICIGYNDFNGDGQLSAGDVIYLQVGFSEYRAWFIGGFSGGASITLNLERYTYLFHIRSSPTINFFNESGAVVDTFDINDVKYALTRGLVQDQPGSPQYMFFKAFLGTMDSSLFNSNTTAPTAMTFAHLLDNIFEISGNDLTMSLGLPFPDNAFKQALSNTWGGIVSKEFSVSIGCWDGNLYTDANANGYPDWWTGEPNAVRRLSRSPYDVPGAFRWVGTGPYRVTVFDSVGYKIVLQRNLDWWQGWPIAGNGNPYSLGYVDTYEIDYISDWTMRKNAFLSGSIDTCAVPRANMFELLSNTTKEPDPSLNPYMKTIKNIQPSLSSDALHFTFTINPASPYIGTGSFPNGIPTDFFNNTHVRKAFAYSFNQTNWIQQMWFGEAYRQYTPLIAGLYPDYRTVTSGYDVNFASAEAEFKQAVFGGQSVWNTGFTVTLLYYGQSERTKMETIKEFFVKLSTYVGRVGNPFTINVAPIIDWLTYLQDFENFLLPTFDIGWIADFADADNFIQPYMHSNGDFSRYQNYTLANGWGNTHGANYPALNKDELIDKAFVTPDGSDRAKMYADLESIYMADCPSLPMPTPTGRRWCQYWVKGWYYNPLYPATYIPSVYKYDDCWFDVSGTTVGISDGKESMRSITYLIARFNAKAPIAGKPVDPRWVGSYGGNGCVDPYSDRTCNMRDIQGAILHFQHRNNTLTP